MDLRPARFPNHLHEHKHDGGQSQSYKRYYFDYEDWPVDGTGRSVYALPVDWLPGGQKKKVVNFSRMNRNSAPVTRIHGSGIELTSFSKDFYPQHMLVNFIFKCV